MKPVFVPYIPEGRAGLMVVSADMPAGMRECLGNHVDKVVVAPALPCVPSPVCSHPDMQIVSPCEGVIVHAPGMDSDFSRFLQNFGYLTVPGEKAPYGAYPTDVPYNAAIVGRHAFLNACHADARLVEWLRKAGKLISHVNQGYAKCSTLILNVEALITSDKGIFQAAVGQHLDALLVPPQKKIVLEGFGYGFIGGATGLISPTALAVAGDFHKLDDAGKIGKFLDKYGIRPVSLSRGDVLDLGSLIPLCSV